MRLSSTFLSLSDLLHLSSCPQDLSTLLQVVEFPTFLLLNDIPRQWHPTPLLLPGKSHGRRAWWAVVHGVAKSLTRLSNFTFTFHFHALEKEMATHSSVLAWRVPGTGEPHGLPSMGSHRVGHDWSDLAAAAARAIYEVVVGLIVLFLVFSQKMGC